MGKEIRSVSNLGQDGDISGTREKKSAARCSCNPGRNVEIQYRGVSGVHRPSRKARHTVRSLQQRRGEQTEIPINHPVTSREPRRSLLPRISQ